MVVVVVKGRVVIVVRGEVTGAVVRSHADDDLALACVLRQDHVTLVTKSALALRSQSHGNSGHLLHNTNTEITVRLTADLVSASSLSQTNIADIGHGTLALKGWNIRVLV